MTEQDKKSAAPREFWVIPENLDLNVRTGFCLEGKPTNNGVALLCVHVIEYSAYEALQIKYDRLWDSRDLAKSDLQKSHDNWKTLAEHNAGLYVNSHNENQELQKRCEEKDETNQKLRFSWLEVQREKLELQSKLAEQQQEMNLLLKNGSERIAEQAAEIERLGKEKIVPHDTFWNKIESDNQIKSLTEQNSILRGGLEFYANKENWGGAHFHTMNKVVMLKGEDVEFEMPSHPFTDKYVGLVAREAIAKADKVKGEM